MGDKEQPRFNGPTTPGLGYRCSRPSPRVRSLSRSACDDWATPSPPPPPPPCVRSRRSSLDPSPATSVRQVFPLAPFPFSSLHDANLGGGFPCSLVCPCSPVRACPACRSAPALLAGPRRRGWPISRVRGGEGGLDLASAGGFDGGGPERQSRGRRESRLE
jgi:hypothetical protein